MVGAAQDALPPAYADYARHFAAGDYLAAGRVLENYWRDHREDFYKALCQLAVALYQYGNGRPAGTRKLLAKARRNLAAYPPGYRGVDVERLRSTVEAGSRAFEAAGAFPADVLAEVASVLREPFSPGG